MINEWRRQPPPPDTVAWVWYLNELILARWDGRNWIDQVHQQVLVGVTHWLPQEQATE